MTLQELRDDLKAARRCCASMRRQIKYLKHKQADKPLTLEKLKQMDGELVWVKRLSEKQDLSCWGFHDEDGVCGYCANFDDDDYGKTWLAYARKPEGRK